jgi:hypothetical protein
MIGNTADDQTHRATWDLLCTLAGRRDFLHVAGGEMATAENMALVHQHGGRFLTLIPRTRGEDRSFREALARGQVRWRPIYDKCDEDGEIVDQYNISEAPALSEEGYRLVWYHSTSKAENDAAMRARRVDRALRALAELQQKLGSPRSRYQERAKVVAAVETILESRGAGGWITTTIEERTVEKMSPGRSRPAERQDAVYKRSGYAIRFEVRARPRGVGGGPPRRWGVPLDHERPDADGAGVVARVQGTAGDREAVRPAQDRLRSSACWASPCRLTTPEQTRGTLSRAEGDNCLEP